MATATATDEAQAVLRSTPTADLLTKAYSLTHLIHVNSNPDGSVRNGNPMVADQRAMRDLITAEVLRRAGDA